MLHTHYMVYFYLEITGPGFVDDNTIKDILSKDEDVKDLAQELISTANDISGKDNISVILIEEK